MFTLNPIATLYIILTLVIIAAGLLMIASRWVTNKDVGQWALGLLKPDPKVIFAGLVAAVTMPAHTDTIHLLIGTALLMLSLEVALFLMALQKKFGKKVSSSR